MTNEKLEELLITNIGIKYKCPKGNIEIDADTSFVKTINIQV